MIASRYLQIRYGGYTCFLLLRQFVSGSLPVRNFQKFKPFDFSASSQFWSRDLPSISATVSASTELLAAHWDSFAFYVCCS